MLKLTFFLASAARVFATLLQSLEAAWRYFIFNNAIPKDGEINAKGMEKVLQLLVEDGTMRPPLLNPGKYIDTTFLEEARRTAQ